MVRLFICVTDCNVICRLDKMYFGVLSLVNIHINDKVSYILKVAYL